MTIAIQGSNAGLAALETLASQANAAQSGTPTEGVGQDQPATADQAAIVDLAGGAGSRQAGLGGALSLAVSASDAALSAGGLIEGALQRMLKAAQSASDPSLGADRRNQFDAGFQANLQQISQAVAGASVDGVNLIDGSASDGQATSSFAGYDLSLGGPLIGVGPGAHLSDAATSSDIAAQLGQAIANVGQALGQIAAQGQAIHGHLAVVAQAANASTTSDLDGDGARLQALQVQQQLAGSGAAISNQAPQAILALFAS